MYDYFKANCGVVNGENNAVFHRNIKVSLLNILRWQRSNRNQGVTMIMKSNLSLNWLELYQKAKGRWYLAGASTQTQTINHDKYISSNFWGYVKDTLQCKGKILPPLTDPSVSTNSKTLACINPSKIYCIIHWIHSSSASQTSFVSKPATYRQIVNAIRQMNSSGSTCASNSNNSERLALSYHTHGMEKSLHSSDS